MTTPMRARLRRLRFALLACAATLVILLGVLAGLTQLAMPWLQAHPQHVEHWLSKKLERPVRIGHLTGAWIGGGPVLALDNVEIGASASGQPGLRIPRAELAFDLYAVALRSHAMTEFRVTGLDLRLVREGGSWQLYGLDIGAPARGNDEPFSLGALGALEIRDLSLVVDDRQNNLHAKLAAPVVRLLNEGRVTRALGRVRFGAPTAPLLDFVADIDVGQRSGEVYLGGLALDLASASEIDLPKGLRLLGGSGAIQLWARLTAGRLDDVRAKVDLENARFGSSAAVAVMEGTEIAPRIAFDRLAFVGRWLRTRDGWTFDLADGTTTTDAEAVPGGLSLAWQMADGTAAWNGSARGLPLQAIGDFAMLAGGMPDALRRWLYLAHPRGLVDSATLRWRGAEDFDVDARVSALGMASVGAVPGFDALDADIRGDAGAVLVHVPQQPLRVDYPHVFREAFEMRAFGGDVVIGAHDGAWNGATDRLAFRCRRLRRRGAWQHRCLRRPKAVRRSLRPRGPWRSRAAKLFLPTITLSPNALEWLDKALVGGHVVSGDAVLRGDLADWPFRDDGGRLSAHAEVSDVTLAYADAWPPAEKIHAFADFINDGLEVHADAMEVMDNKVGEARAAIADYGLLDLDLAAKGEGTGANLLRFLRATPVGERYGEYLGELSVTGRGLVDFTLDLPIKHLEDLTLDGRVALSGAKVDYKRFDLHFLDATGALRFNEKGFSADRVDVGFRERKAVLSLAIGGDVSDPAHAMEASLVGTYPVTTVFADVPVLAPALGRFPGESQWNVAVLVARTDASPATSRLVLSSDLVGIAIDLPPPLGKAASAAVPFKGSLDLPYEGANFSARLGQAVGVSGRVPGPGREFAARIGFGPGETPAPPAQGIAIGGDMAVLDAGAWFDLAGPVGGATVDNLVHTVDIDARDFVLANRHFGPTKVIAATSPATTTIRFEGQALAGELALPTADIATRGIDASFARIHWPDASDESTEPGKKNDMAPTGLPPLRLSVEDFRLGPASFGSAKFVSKPIPDGMRIETLESHSPNVTMTASGDLDRYRAGQPFPARHQSICAESRSHDGCARIRRTHRRRRDEGDDRCDLARWPVRVFPGEPRRDPRGGRRGGTHPRCGTGCRTSVRTVFPDGDPAPPQPGLHRLLPVGAELQLDFGRIPASPTATRSPTA